MPRSQCLHLFSPGIHNGAPSLALHTDDIKHGRDLVQGVLATTVALNTDDVEPAHYLDTRYAIQIRQPLSGVWDPLGPSAGAESCKR